MDFSSGTFIQLSYKHKSKLFDHYDQYFFFLNKYRIYVGDFSEVIAYCMLPDSFHFLIEILDSNQDPSFQLKKLQNKIFARYRKEIILDNIEITKLNSEQEIENKIYEIHFMPVKLGFIDTPDDWEFSSYQEYIDLRQGTLPRTEELKSKYSDIKEIRYNTESLIDDFDMLYK